MPVDNLDGGPVGVSYFGDMDLVNPVIVSPDAGGVYRYTYISYCFLVSPFLIELMLSLSSFHRAKQFREALSKKHEVDCSLAMIVKQRAKANEIDKMDLVGSVDGCDAIIVDDMVDTAGTLCKAAEVLKQAGARRVFAFASHGVLSGPAASRISNSVLTELVVLDTIPLSNESMVSPAALLSLNTLSLTAYHHFHLQSYILMTLCFNSFNILFLHLTV